MEENRRGAVDFIGGLSGRSSSTGDEEPPSKEFGSFIEGNSQEREAGQRKRRKPCKTEAPMLRRDWSLEPKHFLYQFILQQNGTVLPLCL
jgi:hypothetical protein